MKKWLKRIVCGTCAFAFASVLAVTYASHAQAEDNASLAVPYENVTGKYATDILRRTHFNDAVIFADETGTFTDASVGTGLHATPYASYYDGSYAIPMGTYVYKGEKVPNANGKYNAVSAYSQSAYENGMATTGLHSVVAGLSAEMDTATYALSDTLTGTAVRVGTVPIQNVGERAGLVLAQTGLALSTTENGLTANREYTLSLSYTETERYAYSFTADYIAPTLEGLRLDYYDYTENGLDKKRAYLEMDVYDNHYAQAVMLCFADGETLRLATKTPTAVEQTDRNGKATVRIDVTEVLGRAEEMYICLDDYALNGSVYRFSWTALTKYMQPKWDFPLMEGEEELTLAKNEAHAVRFTYSGDFHRTHFVWESSDETVARVQDGVIIGVGEGTTEIAVKVSHADTYTKIIRVNVTEEEVALTTPKYTLESEKLDLTIGTQYPLRVFRAPWYYSDAGITYTWTTSDERVVRVDRNGVVDAVACGKAVVRMDVYKEGVKTPYTASVLVTVTDGFVINNGMLVAYDGAWYNTGSVMDGTAKLVLPEGITRIGKNAFKGNAHIQTVVLPDSVTHIEAGAFANSGLKELVRADEIVVIGDGAFEGCKGLQSFTVGANTRCGKDVFVGCSALENVIFKASVVSAGLFRDLPALRAVTFEGNGTVSIGAHAFANSGKTAGLTLAFGDVTITEIGTGAFVGVQFNENTFTLPVGLQTLGTGVFTGSNIQTLVIPNGLHLEKLLLSGETYTGMSVIVAEDNTQYAVDNGALYALNGENKTLLSVFEEHTGVFDLSGTNVTRIGKYAFAGSNVTAVKLSANTETDGIEEGAFAYTDIETIDFNGVQLTVVPDYAFACSKITGIVLPDSVQTIGRYAFANTKITEIIIPTNVTQIGAYAFAECADLSTVKGSNGVTDIGDYAFYSCDVLQSVAGENVRTVGNGAFEECGTLSVFGDNGTGLETVERIGDRAFYYTNLRGTLPLMEAISVGKEAFKAKITVSHYTAIHMPKVRTIGDEAFAGGAYEEIVLPLCVEEIGAGAFASTSVSFALQRIRFENNATENGKYFVKENVLYRYVNAEKTRYELVCYPAYKTYTSEYAVLEGTVRVGALSFRSVKSDTLTMVTFPQTLQSIGERAFFESSIGRFKFKGLRAPLLEATHSEQVDEQVSRVVASNGKGYYKGLYYMNFNVRFVNLLQDYTDSVVGIGRTIYYPTNGVGYDHFVYKTYFQKKEDWGSQMSEETRMFLEGAYALPLASELSDWKNIEVNAENTATLQAFIARVATVRRFYDNALKDDGQSVFISVEAQQRLFTVEKTLREIRQRFGIPTSVVRVEYVKGSAKEEYNAGETFDLTGALVKVYYDDGSVEETGSGLRLKNNRALDMYDAHTELVYTYNGKEYTSYAVINVIDPDGVVTVEKLDRTLGTVLTIIGGVIVLAGAFMVFQPYFKKGKKEKI